MSFNLADVLKNVSEPDTGREQIQYIPLSQIDSDENNFYQLSDVEDLAGNIATVGLQQPIRVRKHPDKPERYLIVSGHRRRAALDLLENDAPEKWGEVPCIVETDAVSPALQQLRLIYANANTRVMTSAEIGEQAAQVEKLLYQLKEEGYEFPGRMRDHVAQAVGASKTKLARLKVIRDSLIFEWETLYKSNHIGESVAYALAGVCAEWQMIIYLNWKNDAKRLYESAVKEFAARFAKIDKIECPQGVAVCSHRQSMMIRTSKDQWATPCTGCCLSCYNLRTCGGCCPSALAKKKGLLAAEKADAEDAKRLAAERAEPHLARIRDIYQRIGHARRATGVSVEQLYHAEARFYVKTDEAKQIDLELHPERINDVHVPVFGHSLRELEVSVLIRVADLLNVSLDWLLGREGYPSDHQQVGEPDD